MKFVTKAMLVGLASGWSITGCWDAWSRCTRWSYSATGIAWDTCSQKCISRGHRNGGTCRLIKDDRCFSDYSYQCQCN